MYCQQIYVYQLNTIFSILKAAFYFILGKSLSEGYYYSGKIKKKLKELVLKNGYKMAFCYSSQTAQFIIDEELFKTIDFCDVDSFKWKQYSEKKSFPLNIIYNLESRRLSKREKKIYESFNLSLFSTEHERKIFTEKENPQKIYILSNGVDSEYFKRTDKKKKNQLIFVGAMDYYANIEGVLWFANTVFPEILKSRPDLKFYIVGSNPDHRIKKLSVDNKNIVVTGFVNDIRPYLAQSKLAIIPLRIARGIQNKILEAMSIEVPVVIPRAIFNTFEKLDEDIVLVFDNEQSLSKIILDHLDKNLLLEQMGKSLRSYVLKYHNWDYHLNRFNNFLQKRLLEYDEDQWKRVQ
jgi:sugar transferase (PEP-CTERM/EpsH1 system associated)